uniref:SWIM-type domain-containing protein n=1 Tax=Lactuca sativa TaxID=4236 RepID=A0A9R1XQ98_LACSA|nr:hypothetical protein LSAT_V11C200096240 [Lactuca sativa]
MEGWVVTTPRSDLWKCSYVVHNIAQSHVTAIKASLQYSKGRINHRINTKLFKLLPLDMIVDESERCKSSDVICVCQLRTCYRLPCAHEIIMYFNAIFGESLLLSSPLNIGVGDDIHCGDEVKIITKKFEKRPRSIKHNILKNLREFINPSKTSVLEPVVHKTTRGRPSLKKKPFKDNRVDAPIEDPYRHSCSNTYELGLSSTNIHEPPRHSSYADQQNYSYS